MIRTSPSRVVTIFSIKTGSSPSMNTQLSGLELEKRHEPSWSLVNWLLPRCPFNCGPHQCCCDAIIYWSTLGDVRTLSWISVRRFTIWASGLAVFLTRCLILLRWFSNRNALYESNDPYFFTSSGMWIREWTLIDINLSRTALNNPERRNKVDLYNTQSHHSLYNELYRKGVLLQRVKAKNDCIVPQREYHAKQSGLDTNKRVGIPLL